MKPDELPPIDWERVHKGLIPWSAEGYLEVLEFRQRLTRTPKDDWDLARYGFMLELSGEVRSYVLNPLLVENQIGLFIRRRYEQDGVTTVAAHLTRYFEMSWFLQRYRKRFEQEGFIRASEEPGKIEVQDHLFQALAESPLTRFRGRGKHRHRTFDLRAIIRRTRELIDDEGAPD